MHGRLCPVTSPSTIQSGRIQVLTRGPRSVFTIIICRRLRQRDFAAVAGGLTSVGLRPPCVRPPATAHDETQPAEDPLSGTETLSRRSRPPLLKPKEEEQLAPEMDLPGEDDAASSG